MLLKLSRWTTKRADRTSSVRTLNFASALRSFSSWLRGGEWLGKASRQIKREQKARQEKPREFVLLDFGEGA